MKIVKLLTAVAIMTIAFVSTMNAQALTDAQKVVLRQKMQQSQKQLEAATAEMMQTATATKSSASVKRAGMFMANGAGPNSPSSFTLPTYSFPVAYDCGTNTMTTFGVPDFSDNSWGTDYYNWDISTVMFDPFRTAQAAMSERPGLYPLAPVTSELYRLMPIDLNTNGDPSWHSLEFWYQFGYSLSADRFFVGTMNSGAVWLQDTNMPSVSYWVRAQMLLAPQKVTSFLVFQVNKAQSTILGYGPQAFVAAVHLCKLDTYPVRGDLVITKSTNNTVVVAWNTITYPTARYVLSSASYLATNGGSANFSTNIGVPVQYSGLTAYAIFPGTNKAKFFGLSRLY